MIRLSYRLASAALFVFALQGVHAADSAQAQVKFESLDKDSNGKISVSEASENDALFVAFKNLDKDKDGELTKEEFAAFTAAR
jgi:Ca2+-binding EF-hand superfamily protein